MRNIECAHSLIFIVVSDECTRARRATRAKEAIDESGNRWHQHVSFCIWRAPRILQKIIPAKNMHREFFPCRLRRDFEQGLVHGVRWHDRHRVGVAHGSGRWRGSGRRLAFFSEQFPSDDVCRGFLCRRAFFLMLTATLRIPQPSDSGGPGNVFFNERRLQKRVFWPYEEEAEISSC